MSLLTWLEAIGFAVTLLSIWLLIKQRRSGWWWSVLSSVIYIFIYWKAKLYSDAELQLMYIAISIYGYVTWNDAGKKEGLAIKVIQRSVFIIHAVILIVVTIIWGFIHSRITDASLPYLDALLASTCIAAQWMMARKYFQCWYLWIFANTGYIILYMLKELTGTTILYIILFYFTMKGYREWNRAMKISIVNI